MLLALEHPEIPSCADCQAWLYDARWQRCRRAGQDLPRPRGAATPCRNCPKAEDGLPAPHRELSPKNRRALDYYRLCQADTARQLPRDLIVMGNHAAIRQAEDLVRQARANVAPLLLALLKVRT